MANLLTLPVTDEGNVVLDDVAALLGELLGDDFEDVVISNNGEVVYAGESFDRKTVNR